MALCDDELTVNVFMSCNICSPINCWEYIFLVMDISWNTCNLLLDEYHFFKIWVNTNGFIFLADDSETAYLVDVYATKGVSDGLNGKIMVRLLTHH